MSYFKTIKEKLKKYEKAQDRVEKGRDIIDSLNIIINDYKEDKDVDFRVIANELEEIAEEIAQEIEEDEEIVNEYEKEEYEEEKNSLNFHEI